MLSRAFTLFALSLSATRAFALSGYAHGPDHCYHFASPQGWTMDNRALAREGVPMAFFPAGTTWQSASVAMYTRAVASASGQPDAQRVKEKVDEVVAMYRASSQDITATQVRSLRSEVGAPGELWRFAGYRNGGTELVVYFPAPQTINYFVMQVGRYSKVETSMPALLELVASYRPATDCKPCSEGTSCTTPK